MIMPRMFLAFLTLAFPLYSQPFNQDENLFSRYAQARAGLAGEPLKCGLPTLAALLHASPRGPQASRLAKLLSARPVLPNSYFTSDNRFRIHYATSGTDAVSPVSTNPDGVPDFVYEAGQAAQRSYALLVDTLRMKPHASDGGVDGPEYDFYIINLGNLYGETRFDFATGAGPAYTVLDNDYDAGFYSQGLDGLRVTVAHEYFHAVQLNYYLRGEDIFFFEISSVWFEDRAYDEVNDYFAYLPRWFRETSLPLNFRNGSHEYGSGIFMHFLTQRLGEENVVRALWERIQTESALNALKAVLQSGPYHLPFSAALQEFYTWCFFTNYRADVQSYFEEGEDYPVVRYAVSQTLSQNETVPDVLEPLAAKYYRFIRTAQDVQGGLQISVDPARFGLTGIGYDQSGNYFTRTGYGLAPIFVAGQARQDTVVYLVVNSGSPQSGGGTNNYNLQLVLGSQLELEDALEPPYPNPFRPGRDGFLRIPYRIKQTAVVEAAIYGEDGRVVWSTKSRTRQPVGPYEILWNGKDDSGQAVPSGVYVMRLLADGFAASTKFVVVNR